MFCGDSIRAGGYVDLCIWTYCIVFASVHVRLRRLWRLGTCVCVGRWGACAGRGIMWACRRVPEKRMALADAGLHTTVISIPDISSPAPDHRENLSEQQEVLFPSISSGFVLPLFSQAGHGLYIPMSLGILSVHSRAHTVAAGVCGVLVDCECDSHLVPYPRILRCGRERSSVLPLGLLCLAPTGSRPPGRGTGW